MFSHSQPFLLTLELWDADTMTPVSRISIVQKCLLNGILVRECVHNYLYEVMPIFLRRYLLAWEEVAKYVGFR